MPMGGPPAWNEVRWRRQNDTPWKAQTPCTHGTAYSQSGSKKTHELPEGSFTCMVDKNSSKRPPRTFI
ncbi:MAG: hypothetical protein ACK56F_20175, partial [bacterium]